MKKILFSYSIKHKLARTIIFTTIVALMLAIIVFITQDVVTMKDRLNERLNTQANIISDNISAALLFNDPDTANEILSALKHDASIVTAAIVSNGDDVFVQYNNQHYVEKSESRVIDIANDENDMKFIKVVSPILYNTKNIGKVIILASDKEINERVLYFLLVSFFVLFFALGLALLLSKRMQQLIYMPIQHLAGIAEKVSEEKNYKIRAKIFEADELGKLTESFNHMLAQIQVRDENLEALVDERTEEIKDRNKELHEEVSERKKVQKDLEDSEERFKSAFNNAAIGMALVKKDHSISQANTSLCKMLGCVEDEIKGTYFREWTFTDDVNESIEKHAMLVEGTITDYQIEKRYVSKSGEIIWGLLNVSGVFDKNNEFVSAIAQVQDITAARNLSDELSYQASHDSLTNLVNRREFERRLRNIIETREKKSEHALLYLDLDQFKVVNDTCGHTAGDELLIQLARIMEEKIRQRDTLGRLGGDEFGVLMEYCSLEHAVRVADELRETIQDYQFLWEQYSFKVGVSIGLVAINNETLNLQEVLQQADIACYMAKELGRNRTHVYQAKDIGLSQKHGEMKWVNRIHKALEEDSLCFYAQSIVPLDRTHKRHYELLIRMKDEQGRLIQPGAFLPAAERYNLMYQIDCWVIQKAFQAITKHPDFLNQINFISINLSGQSLANETFMHYVISELQDSNIDASKICFEITETAAIANLSIAIKFISKLKNQGCQFALDDFGSGLSSFGYLKNLPVDYLKIDGMFVKDIVDDPIDHAMVKSINEIGQVMGMETIAEFVENDEIKGMLREIGVNYAQGYGIDKPLSLDELLNRSNNVLDINNAKY